MIGFLPRPRIFVEDVAADEADALAEIHGEAFARAWSADDFAALMAGQNVFALGAPPRVAFRHPPPAGLRPSSASPPTRPRS